jgi:tetratricopeptide (TPR) repeat protein
VSPSSNDRTLGPSTRVTAVGLGAAPEYTNRGAARATAGDLTGAIADLDEAVRIDPEFYPALINRGVLRHARGDAAGAVADFTAALRLAPQSAEAYTNRGAIRLEKWDLTGAVADYDAALALDPQSACARLARGHAHYHLNDPAAAEHDYRAAFLLDPTYYAERIVQVLIEQIQRDVRAAMLDSDRHLHHTPDDFHSLARRGILFLLQGQDAEAQRDFDHYRQLNPIGVPRIDALIAEARQRRFGDKP